MKFLRTFLCNTEDEIAAARAHMPDAPAFACCVIHGPDRQPARIDLFASARPHETSEKPFATYQRNADDILVTDYIAPVAVAAPTKGKRKGKRT